MSFSTPGRLLTALLLFVSVLGMQLPAMRCLDCCQAPGPHPMSHPASAHRANRMSGQGLLHACTHREPSDVPSMPQPEQTRHGQLCPASCTSALLAPDTSIAQIQSSTLPGSAFAWQALAPVPQRFGSFRFVAQIRSSSEWQQQNSPQAVMRLKRSPILQV